MRSSRALSAGIIGVERAPVERGLLGRSARFDWIMVGLSALIGCGGYLDAWAHRHIPQMETFFTPWHAVLYSGFASLALVLVGSVVLNRSRGHTWRASVPAGYELAVLGTGMFAVGGMLDMAWHVLFGIEQNLEAVVSPTHLLLMVSGGLILSGPLRAAWRRPGATAPITAVLSAALVLNVLDFFAQVAHPYVDLLAQGQASGDQAYWAQLVGILSVALQAAISTALVLLLIRRFRLPKGSLALLFGVNAVVLSLLEYHFLAVPVALLAGAGADLLLAALRPGPSRPWAVRAFAAAVPALIFAAYFAALLLTGGVWWSVHMWVGSIALAGIVGWLVSFLVFPGALESGPA